MEISQNYIEELKDACRDALYATREAERRLEGLLANYSLDGYAKATVRETVIALEGVYSKLWRALRS